MGRDRSSAGRRPECPRVLQIREIGLGSGPLVPANLQSPVCQKIRVIAGPLTSKESRLFDASAPARRLPGSALPKGPPPWTPETVEGELTEAARWLHLAGGRAGPLGFVGSRLHDTPLSLHEHIAEFGCPPERADLDNEREAEREAERLHFRMLPAARLDQLETALRWPARFLLPTRPETARAVQAWVAAKAARRGFAPVCRERGLNRTRA